MMDQYNMDQYNKETSQIHAPADLIRRTKEAVRQEEQRIARERMQQDTVLRPKKSYGKVYKWALPVSAAAVCVLLLNVAVMGLGSGKGKSQSDTSMDMSSGGAPASDSGMEMQFGAADIARETADAAAEESVGRSNSTSGMTAGVTTEAADEAYGSDDYDGELFADSAVSSEAGNDMYDAAESEEVENSYIKSIYSSDLWLEEIEEASSAYFDSNTDTESIIIHGVVLYVAQDLDHTWIAYVEIDRQKYVVRGELTEEDISREEFAEEAYKLLEDTVYSIK